MVDSTSKFSAADSALGYLYQVRVALLWALRRMKTDTQFFVSLETLDDVAFETITGNPAEVLQTKHHQSKAASLSNSSSDLWKSLRVWFEGYSKGSISLSTTLYLLTTVQAPSTSIASYLRPSNERNIDAALDTLLVTAQTSTNALNASAYKIFLEATPAIRKALIEQVFVIDSSPSIQGLDEELTKELFWAVERKFLEVFLERLEGWWFRRSIKQLLNINQGDRIMAVEIEAQMSDLREQFKQESLPIDEDLLAFDLDELTKSAHINSKFVRQMEITGAGKKRIAAAIRDYFRAFEQRSRWLRNDLLLVGDLGRYEKRLLEEWELVFEAMRDDLGSSAADEAKRKAALEMLKWAETILIPIRPSVVEPFVTRGSLHMLSDEVRLGWHPDFQEMLTALLTGQEKT